VINTLNEEKKLPRTLASVRDFSKDIVVVDMMSTDKTRELAKSFGARVFKHKKINYVEPARNFAIEKAKNEWVLILDPDEEVKPELKNFFKKEIKTPKGDYYRIPRKNIIFGKWMKYSGWWPDFNIRFFRKGNVSWGNKIHSIPITTGVGIDLPIDGKFAIKHMHYSSLEEYITRMNRYTTVQVRDLVKSGKEFSWIDLIVKPTAEFLRRYFAEKGYKDGLHGLALSLLQSASELVLYLKLWQKQGFYKKKMSVEEVSGIFKNCYKDFVWWIFESKLKEEKNIFRKLWLKIKRKYLPL